MLYNEFGNKRRILLCTRGVCLKANILCNVNVCIKWSIFPIVVEFNKEYPLNLQAAV